MKHKALKKNHIVDINEMVFSEDLKKQTAIEWFANQLGIKSGSTFEQAKEMEKIQMKEAVLSQVTTHKRFRKIFEQQFEYWYSENYSVQKEIKKENPIKNQSSKSYDERKKILAKSLLINLKNSKTKEEFKEKSLGLIIQFQLENICNHFKKQKQNI